MGKNNSIIIRGARSNNLKGLDIDIPKDKLVVITGLSGSGKSSLAFDTIYAEGQRKYVESLSSYARQFLGVMDKPDVDHIEGLSPAISIDQKSSGHNPRSTVGTITEIYDYLRLLFARAGHPHSPITGKRLQSQTAEQIVNRILELGKIEVTKVILLAPIIKKRKGTYEELFSRLLSQGYLRVRVDGQIYSLEEDIKLDRYKIHSIDLVVDRLVVKSDSASDPELLKRLTDSVELSLNMGNKELLVNLPDKNEDLFFSEHLVDPSTGESFPEIAPHSFSFNSPFGMCTNCNGLGFIQKIQESELFNPKLTIAEGGLFPWSRSADSMNSWYMLVLDSVAKSEGFSLRTQIGKLSPEHLKVVLYGTAGKKYPVSYYSKNEGREKTAQAKYDGLIPTLERRYQQTESDFVRKEIEQYMVQATCESCNGARLKPESLSVTIERMNIRQVCDLPISSLEGWLEKLREEYKDKTDDDSLSDQERTIVRQVVKEIGARTKFLLSVGLDYLTLNRTARTLSGGEAQRIRLASQIGTGLSGVLYVLDEPSIGLHQRDNQRLIDTLHKLRDLGNSILVVEHDEDTMMQADYLIDIGPGAGAHGGQVVAQGKPSEVVKHPQSLTGKYLSKQLTIDRAQIIDEANRVIRKGEAKSPNKGKSIKLSGASGNNLKDVDLTIPLGKFVVITGVSGSGKSTLINETLVKVVNKHLHGSKPQPAAYKKISGLDNIDSLINIDQSPIGRTPRSNPATYTGVFNFIREMYAATPEAKTRGYKAGRFSFNVRGGRCETCKGDGVLKIEMQFLPDVYVKCEECQGKRYNRETLQIDYKGKSISDVLEMSVEEALPFFENIHSIYKKLETLNSVGLGYIKLGQPATTLSGGESQRIKLAAELSKRSTGKTLYVLDEPTTGLHFEDLRKLLIVLHSLVLKGNSVVVIEHNLDLVKTADHIVDIGPEGGEKGGQIIAEGTPAEVAANKKSYTGEWLAK